MPDLYLFYLRTNIVQQSHKWKNIANRLTTVIKKSIPKKAACQKYIHIHVNMHILFSNYSTLLLPVSSHVTLGMVSYRRKYMVSSHNLRVHTHLMHAYQPVWGQHSINGMEQRVACFSDSLTCLFLAVCSGLVWSPRKQSSQNLYGFDFRVGII